MNTSASLKIKGMSPQFLVADMNRSIEFYTGKLGFGVSFRYEDFYAGLTRDGYSIHLKSGKPAIGERENKKNNEHLDITFLIAGIETLYEDIKNKSVEIIQAIRDMPYGREFYIADPDGHIIAFVEEK